MTQIDEIEAIQLRRVFRRVEIILLASFVGRLNMNVFFLASIFFSR